MKTDEDIESYMLQLDLQFESVGDHLWLVHDDDNLENVVVSFVDPILLFHVRVADLPGGDMTVLYRKLLELNASDMIHGAYGIEGDSIIMIDTLQAENLDLNEFQASLEAMSVSLIQHYPVLKSLLGKLGGSGAAKKEVG